jgi:hypothetical protein
MPEIKVTGKRHLPFDIFAALAERDALEASENVRLARSEEGAWNILADQLRELRDLEKRGRFLKAQGFTPELLDELLGGEDHA